MKRGGLDTLDPRLLVECAYNTSKAFIAVLVVSLLGRTDLNYVAHKGCVHRESADRRKQRDFLEATALTRQ